MKKTTLILLSLFLVFIIFLVVKKEKENTEIVEWNSPKESIALDYFVGKEGQLYFEGQLNGTTGLFFFDTGFDISVINEKYITGENLNLQSYSIKDAKGIIQTKNLYKVSSFELGAITIKDLNVYPADSLSWKDPKGIFYNQDSVIGIIGNNIISKFIWDFDMVNRRVTISNSKTYCDTIPDSLAFELVPIGNHKAILARINGKLKRFTLDFGASSPISLSDSIPNKKESEKKSTYSTSTKSAFNHLEPKEVKDSKFDFVDVKFGSYEFNEIQCFENVTSSLLGMPFVWSFKRVVIDYMNNKAYFITLKDSGSDFGIMKFNRQSIWSSDGVKSFQSKPEGFKFIIDKDSIKIKYVAYGKLMLYSKSNQIDSIFCSDSIRFPDGKMKYGPLTTKIVY